jgi:hypothetical protein
VADGVPVTPGAGVEIASREVPYSGENMQMQVVGLATLEGADDAKVATDISPDNPIPIAAYGELIEVLEAMRMGINSLAKSIGFALPNAQGFPMMEARQTTAANLQVTASLAATQTLATLTTLTTLVNQQQIGGNAANDLIPAYMHLQADGLRYNITVT